MHGSFLLVGVLVGMLVGFLCRWIWPAVGPSPLVRFRLTGLPARRRMATCYFTGAVVLGGIATAIGGVASLLWWGTLALALVGLIYAGPGAAGFQKHGGLHSPPVLVLLAPFLLAACLLPRWRTRGYPEPSAVRDGVWLGRLPFACEMAQSQFAALVDLTAELSIAPGPWRYASLPLLDAVPPAPADLAEAARTIEALRMDGGPVLVACALGHTRSACAVATWLILTGRAADADDAIHQLRTSRPQVVFRPAHTGRMRAYACKGGRRRPLTSGPRCLQCVHLAITKVARRSTSRAWRAACVP